MQVNKEHANVHPLRGSYYNQIKVLYDYNKLKVLTYKTIKVMNNKRKASIDDILKVKRMIKLHTAILSNKKVIFKSDEGDTNEVSDIIGSAIIAFNYKIILKDKTNHTRTIEQTENIIKTIMILTEW